MPRRRPFFPREIIPGLVVRLMSREEATPWGLAVERSGLIPHGEIVAFGWWYNPQAWPIIATWRGRPLQWEVYFLGQREPERARAGFNLHAGRRPWWFWGVIARAIFENLKSVGIEYVESWPRADLPEYLEGLKASYGGQEIGRTHDGKWARYRYRVNEAIALCPSFPPRRTLPGWTWRSGPYAAREAEPEALAREVEARWAGRKRGRDALRLLDERFHLDRGTALRLERAGQFRAAVIVWPRRERFAGVTVLGPLGDEEGGRAMIRAEAEWMLAAGYDQACHFLPRAETRIAASMAALAMIGDAAQEPKPVAHGTYREVVWDIRRALEVLR